jgi:hypothetical protein
MISLPELLRSVAGADQGNLQMDGVVSEGAPDYIVTWPGTCPSPCNSPVVLRCDPRLI